MDKDDTAEDPAKVTEQRLSQPAMPGVHRRAADAQQAFDRYFEVTAREHPYKPAAHFNHALLLLSLSDLRYALRCHVAGVTQQTAAAAKKAAATAQGTAAAASNPDLWPAMVVLRQVLEDFNQHVVVSYQAGLAAEADVPRWFRTTHLPLKKTPHSVKAHLAQRERTVANIKALELQRGGAAAQQAAAGSSSSSSSSNGRAAAGVWPGASSSSSSSTTTTTTTTTAAAAAAAAAAGVGSSSSSSSSAVPPATEDELRAALLQLVAASDINGVSYKQLHQQLEAKFQMDLSHKKSFLKQVLLEKVQVPANAQAQAPAPAPPQQQQQQQQQQPGLRAGGSSSSSSSSSGRSAGRASSPAAAAVSGSARAKSSSCCKVCGARQQKLLRCSRCKAVKYCSAACQTQDWKAHKAVCIKKT
ncbi:hypothetical protein COO60DRAFT_822653 [Scenedesmus sp. NREL 46B-D3]|nr:hypothetical protein COO60DRAFT_822653 [Scenedesmus sp. NREL 46B-D3]